MGREDLVIGEICQTELSRTKLSSFQDRIPNGVIIRKGGGWRVDIVIRLYGELPDTRYLLWEGCLEARGAALARHFRLASNPGACGRGSGSCTSSASFQYLQGSPALPTTVSITAIIWKAVFMLAF